MPISAIHFSGQRIALCIALVFSFQGSIGQNLVTYGDFETFTECPTGYSHNGCTEGLNAQGTGWDLPSSGSADFLTSCAPPHNIGVPKNWMGNEPAHSGNGYGGFISYYQDSLNVMPFPLNKEYLQTRLSKPLLPNRLYHFEMFLSLGENSAFVGRQVGVYFSSTHTSRCTNGPNYSDWAELPFTPQITAPEYLQQKDGWYQVTADYIAKGGEEYIIIGDFNTYANAHAISLKGKKQGNCYYYVDDVSLIEDDEIPVDSLPDSLITKLIIPNVFTPNGDGMNDRFTIDIAGETDYSLMIYNRWGKKVFESGDKTNQWNGTAENGSEYTTGTYFFVFNYRFKEQDPSVKTGTVTLIR